MTSQSKLSLSGIMLLAGMALHAPAALALFEPGAGIGLQYTDNAGLTPDNEDEDLLVIGYIGANIDQGRGPLNFKATTSLTYENYTDNTFSDQYYFDLSASANWEMVRDRVNWLVRDYFTQRLRNTINRSTPNNIEDVNIFNLSPDFALPLSRVQKLVINPEFSDFYYEDSDTDNQQYSLALDWLYSLSSTHEIGLGGAISKVDYEDEDKNPNFTGANIHAIYGGQLARSKYKLNLGFTRIDRDDLENRSAPTGGLDWVFTLTGHSDARLYMASDLTNSSYTALESAIDPGRGDIDNVQNSGDIFRNNVLRASYIRGGATLNSKLWAELRDLDYKETPQDQEVQNFGFRLNYQARKLLSSGLYARYRRNKRTEQDRTDKTYVIGGELGYQLSRKMRTVFNLQYQNKDSTDDAQEFSEFSGLINLVYGYGEVARKKTARSF